MRASTSSLACLALLAAPLVSASGGINLLQLNTANLLKSVDKTVDKLLNGSIIADVHVGTSTDQVTSALTDSLDHILKRNEQGKRAAAVEAAPKMVKLRRRGVAADPDRLIDKAHAEKKRQLDHHAQERANLANRRAGKRRLGGDLHGLQQDHPELARRALSLNELFTKVNKVVTDTTAGANGIILTTEGTAGADVKTVEDIVTGTLTTREIPEADKVFIKRAYSKQDLFTAVNKILTDTTGGANDIVATTEVTVGSDVLTVEQILEGLTA